jgi:predicted phage terminase large subunit-like protein
MRERILDSAESELEKLLNIRRRKRLLTFIPTITPKFKAPYHLAPMLEKIELSRLTPVLELVSTPPRHGKTETLLHAIAWILRQDPSLTCAYVTHSGELAKSKSRRAKRMALAAGVQLAPGSKAVNEWRTTSGGGLIATSVGGSFTGRGADFMIVDDPVKDREEAESELQREKVWDWFNNVAFTRLEPGASTIVNMTRWHEDDLIGRLQRSELPWHTVVLPALGGENEDQPLWPERFTVEALRRIKKQVGEYTWQSLYQGRPTNKAGSVFKRAWFTDNLVDIIPSSFDYKVITVDGAWSTGVGADYSCIGVWGVSRATNSFYLIHREKARLEFPDLLRLVVATYTDHPTAVVGIEYSSSGIAVYQTLRRETTLPVVPIPVHTKKETRAEEVSPIVESGRCKFPRRAPWLNDYVDTMCAFPNGAHDDDVDMTSLALKRIVEVERGRNVDVFLGDSLLVPADNIPHIYQR